MAQQHIILGDCIDVFANERNVPAFVSDPPANIAFMGRSWDRAIVIAEARHAYWSSLSLSAIHAIMTEGDTSKAIRFHERHLDAIAAE